MNKVKLPKEVAEAIEYYALEAGKSHPIQTIMKVAIEDVRYIGDPDICQVIKEYVKPVGNLHTLMSALVNGYEVEETPEDKVRELHKHATYNLDMLHDHPVGEYWKGKLMGISDTLDAYNIKIEGVNR